MGTKTKGDTIRALMSSSKTTKLLRDAIKSPLGSTSRKQAQRILNIMDKLYGKNDGSGGPGFMNQYQSNNSLYTTTKKPSTPKGMVVFPKVPTPNIYYGKRKDGSGGPGFGENYTPLGSVQQILGNTYMSNPISSAATSSIPTVTFSSLWNDVKSAGSLLNKVIPTIPVATQKQTPASYSFSESFRDYKPFNVPGYYGGVSFNSPSTSPQVGNQIPSVQQNTSNVNTPTSNAQQYTTPVGPQPQGINTPTGTSVGQPSSPGYNTEQIIAKLYNPDLYPNVYQQTFGKAPPTPIAPITETGASTSSQTPTSGTPQTSWDPEATIRNAIAGGVGPQTAAWRTMMDPNGPFGGLTLTEYTNKIEEDNWKKYDIANSQKEIARLKKINANLPSDLKDFVAVKGEELNEINKAINEELAKPATSDPNEQQSRKSYLNYLYMRKGKITKRYSDYIQTSVAEHTNEINSLIDTYNINLDAYQKETESDKGIAKEIYENYFNSLQDMYTNIENIPARALQLEALTMQVLQAKAEMAASGIKNVAQIDFYKDRDNLAPTMLIDKRFISPETLSQLNEKMSDYGQLTDTSHASILQVYVEGVLAVLGAADGTKYGDNEINLQTKINTASAALKELQELQYIAGHLGKDQEEVAVDTIAEAERRETQIASELAMQIASSTNDNIIEQVKEIISSLKGNWRGKIPSRTEFAENMVKSVSGAFTWQGAQALANRIYDKFENKGDATAEEFVNQLFNDRDSPLEAKIGEYIAGIS